MAELIMKSLVKVYPFTEPGGILGRKKRIEAFEKERRSQYTTNEGILAVQNFSLEVEHGEFVVILGASGSGKSTLLRMLAGLESVSAGEIWFNKKQINELSPEDRDVAMVFQDYALYSHLTVYGNIAYTLKNQHVPREEINTRVMQVLEDLELTAYKNRWPRELSGGQQQRVAIGRALIRRPSLFLMDEPFSNLDPSMRSQLRMLVQRLHKKYGTTFIYVTHDQTDALVLATKIVLMQSGIILQTGTPQDLFHRPENQYCASFVGAPQINFFPQTELLYKGSNWQIVLGGISHCINAQGLNGQNQSAIKVIPAIRPVYVSLSGEGIPMIISYAEPLGAEVNLYLKGVAGEVTVVVPQREAVGISRGSQVFIKLAPEHLLFFCPQTGKRICV